MTGIPAAAAIAVADLIGEQVVRVSADATVAEVAAALVGNDVGAVVIGDDDRPAALISERDIAKVVAAGQDPTDTRALDVASKNLLWCAADATVAQVAVRMTDRHIRHLLVERDGSLVGIISARDLLGVYASDADRLD